MIPIILLILLLSFSLLLKLIKGVKIVMIITTVNLRGYQYALKVTRRIVFLIKYIYHLSVLDNLVILILSRDDLIPFFFNHLCLVWNPYIMFFFMFISLFSSFCIPAFLFKENINIYTPTSHELCYRRFCKSGQLTKKFCMCETPLIELFSYTQYNHSPIM